MPQCVGHKRDGGRCTAIVRAGDSYCYAHDPARADDRRRNASKAGKSKPNKELADLKREVRGVVAGVLTGRIDKGSGSVALQGYNTLIRASEQERRLLETQELADRVAELEETLEEGRRRTGS